MSKTTKNIELFTSHFDDHIDHINTLPSENYHLTYKKLLYVAIIDVLSKSVFPSKNNRDKFVAFLQNFSDWEYGERVSLTHLAHLLRKNPDPALGKVRQYVNKRLINWIPGNIITLDNDPQMNEVMKYWPKKKEFQTPNDGISLKSIRHWNLLYAYRNFLVHEFRSPGHSIESINDRYPTYIHFTTDDFEGPVGEIGEWILNYPVVFFHTVCKSSLENLTKYLKKNNLDPTRYFTFGSYFIEQLNM